MAFYPNANRTIKGNGSGSHLGGPYKGVLHTTEGGSATGAIGAFKNNNSWPHFLIDYLGTVWQFLDTTVGGRALRNLSGGVQTNLDSAIQVELVGFAGKPTEHAAAQMDALKALMRWVEVTVGVKPVGPGRPFATKYGQTQLRFTNKEWDEFAGWCGHCHVPENDHWDPGTLNLEVLLPLKEVKAMYSPNLVLEPIAAHLAYNGGTYLAADSGALYAFDAPGIRGPNGEPYFVGRHLARLYPGDSQDPEIPDYVGRAAGGLIVQTTSNEWYGPYTAA